METINRIVLILLLTTASVNAQVGWLRYQTVRQVFGKDTVETILMTDTTVKYKTNGKKFEFNKTVKIAGDTAATRPWVREQLTKGSPFDSTFNGQRTTTRVGFPAINPNTTDIKAFLEEVFYPSTNPTTSSSGGTTLEYTSVGNNYTGTLSWGVTRPVACLSITSITADGVSQVIDSPFNEGHTQTGTKSVSVAANTNKSVSTQAVSVDGKSGTSSTTWTWSWKRYWGRFNSAVPPTDGSFTISDAQILALTGAGVGTGSEFASSLAKDLSGINGNGWYVIVAMPSSWGVPKFRANGLQTTAWTKVRDNVFVNSSGGTTNYQVWVSNTTFSTPIASFQIY